MGTWLRLMVIIAGLTLAIQLAPSHVALAQQSNTASNDEAAVRKTGADYLAAVERGDPKEIAEFWTAEGVYVDASGKKTRAHDVIAKSFGGDKSAPPEMSVSDVAIRFVTPEVAIEEGVCQTTPAAGQPVSGRFAALWVKRDGRWKLDSLRESYIPADDAPGASSSSAAEHLAVLEPFVGEWSGSQGKLSMNVAARWNPNKTFLRREIAISSDGKALFTSTQWIGWDPVARQIRSWQFNGDGGYGEGIWELAGSTWMMVSAGVLPGGGASSATQTFKFADRDTMAWKLAEATALGQSLPPLEIKLSRKSSGR